MMQRHSWAHDGMKRDPQGQWILATAEVLARLNDTTVDCAHCHKTFAGPGFCCERDDCPHAANRVWPTDSGDGSKK